MHYPGAYLIFATSITSSACRENSVKWRNKLRRCIKLGILRKIHLQFAICNFLFASCKQKIWKSHLLSCIWAYVIFVILLTPAPFSADTKNTDFSTPKNTKLKIFTPKHTNSRLTSRLVFSPDFYILRPDIDILHFELYLG